MSKKKKRKIIEHNTMSLGKTVSDSEQYLQSINIREKRIGLVFKVIYVVAIFTAAILLDVINRSQEGIRALYIAEAGVSVFLLFLLGYIVSYIINEMKCLKLTASELPQKVIDNTEKSYSKLFDYLFVGGIITVIITMIAIIFRQHINRKIMESILTISLGLFGGCFLIGRVEGGLFKKCIDYIQYITEIMLLMSMFILAVL